MRFSECEISGLPIDATTLLADLHYVDLFPAERRAAGLAKLVSALSRCPLLKRLKPAYSPEVAGEHLIAQRTFRVGEGIDPIEDAATTIVCKGSSESIGQLLDMLKETFNGLVSSAYDHGDGIYEVVVHAPIGSVQLSILAQRCDMAIQSIDHVPEPFYSDFLHQLRRYTTSDHYMRRVIAETANPRKPN